MHGHKPQPIASIDNLRERVERLLKERARPTPQEAQLSLGLATYTDRLQDIEHPTKSISAFLDFLVDAVPDGDVYLFGGVLRDTALFGRRGFDSDIDLVVEGAWPNCVRYLESVGASRNKFGGYRLRVSGWPVDIWSAKETWAIREGLVAYTGISSLLQTTVLNWDAILMSWRTRIFVCRSDYVDDIRSRVLNIVLERNPDPLGMAVRVFRHLCLKDARRVTVTAAEYLADCTKRYSFDEIRRREIDSYGASEILAPVYRLFEHFGHSEGESSQHRIGIASDLLERELKLQ